VGGWSGVKCVCVRERERERCREQGAKSAFVPSILSAKVSSVVGLQLCLNFFSTFDSEINIVFLPSTLLRSERHTATVKTVRSATLFKLKSEIGRDWYRSQIGRD